MDDNQDPQQVVLVRGVPDKVFLFCRKNYNHINRTTTKEKNNAELHHHRDRVRSCDRVLLGSDEELQVRLIVLVRGVPDKVFLFSQTLQLL